MGIIHVTLMDNFFLSQYRNISYGTSGQTEKSINPEYSKGNAQGQSL